VQPSNMSGTPACYIYGKVASEDPEHVQEVVVQQSSAPKRCGWHLAPCFKVMGVLLLSGVLGVATFFLGAAPFSGPPQWYVGQKGKDQGKARRDELAIIKLLTKYRCQHVYLDFGSNIGIQMRKLYEPTKFPGAKIRPFFNEYFGQHASHRCRVCSIGSEPNPKHRQQLLELQGNLTRMGFGVLIFGAAIAAVDDHYIEFNMGTLDVNEYLEAKAVLVGETVPLAQRSMVRTIDLARLVKIVDRALRDLYGSNRNLSKIVMKMDIEGSEYETLPHLMMTGAMCMVDYIHFEGHARVLPTEWQQRWAAAEDQLYQHLFQTASPTCSTRIVEMDDETYGWGGLSRPPWTNGKVCLAKL